MKRGGGQEGRKMAGAAGESLRPGLASAEPQNLCWFSKGKREGEWGSFPGWEAVFTKLAFPLDFSSHSGET